MRCPTSIAITYETKNALKVEADEKKWTLSFLINEILKDYVKKGETK